MVEASYYSLRELMEADRATSEVGGSPSSLAITAGEEGNGKSQLALWKDCHLGTSAWLYKVLFLTYAESRADAYGDLDADEVEDHSASSTDGKRNTSISSFPAAQKPLEPRKVVEELLHQWTDLSDDEIRYVVGKTASTREFSSTTSDNSTQEERKFGDQFAPKTQASQSTSTSLEADTSDLKEQGQGMEKFKLVSPLNHANGEVIELEDATKRKLVVPYRLIKSWSVRYQYSRTTKAHTKCHCRRWKSL